jgi:hypothetical protein
MIPSRTTMASASVRFVPKAERIEPLPGPTAGDQTRSA